MNIKRDFEIKRNGGEPPEEEIKDASQNADPDAAFFSTTQGGSSLSEDKKAEIEALKKQMSEANSLAEEEEDSQNFQMLTSQLTRTRTIKRKKTELFRKENS